MSEEKKRVLLVDDEEDLVAALSVRLEASGFEVLVAKDGLEALKRSRTDNPDLIVLDLMLPKMDGYKVARLLKFDKRYSHIPILILTARGEDSDREMSRKVGADDYMVKPFASTELISRLRKLLEAKEKVKQKI